MNFNQFNLDSRLAAGIARAGYAEPTPVQKEVIPMAVSGNDLIVTAQTGTGKTAAFVLPVIHKLLAKKSRSMSVLIVTPTRELAAQIQQNIIELKPGPGIRSTTIYGGVGANPQIRTLRSGVEILVACPGRLLDLMSQGHISLDKVDTLILDEADRMLDMGFLPDIKKIIAKIPAGRQTMLFSATFPKEIEQLAKKTLNNPKRVSIGISRPAHTVSHAVFPVPQHLKAKLLFRLLKRTSTESVLVFTRTKYRAKRLAQQLEQKGYTVTSLHGNRSQGQRDEAVRGFRSGIYNIMVATDIAARGLDIENISHVINFDIPGTPDDYIHRIGRTGRARRTGDAFTLITSADDGMILKLEKIIGSKIERKVIEDFDYNTPKPKNDSPPSCRKPGARQQNNRPRRYGASGNKKTFQKRKTS